MSLRIMTALALACAGGLTACTGNSADAEDPVAAVRAGNTMECVSGGETFSGKGEQIGIGSIGGNGKQLTLSLDLRVERDNKVHVISSGMLGAPMAPGTIYLPELDKEGGSGGTYDLRDAEENLIKQFDGSTFGLSVFTPAVRQGRQAEAADSQVCAVGRGA